MRHTTVRITLRRLDLIEKAWFWYLRLPIPRSEGVSRKIKNLKWARLVPMRFGGFHQRYAAAHHLYWLPCVLCMTPYGGHQSGGRVPDPMNPPGGPLAPLYYVGICPRCTRAGKGDRS